MNLKNSISTTLNSTAQSFPSFLLISQLNRSIVPIVQLFLHISQLSRSIVQSFNRPHISNAQLFNFPFHNDEFALTTALSYHHWIVVHKHCHLWSNLWKNSYWTLYEHRENELLIFWMTTGRASNTATSMWSSRLKGQAATCWCLIRCFPRQRQSPQHPP